MQTSDPLVHEVEVKYQVWDTKSLAAALGRARVSLQPPVAQDDQAYAPAAWAYGMSKLGVPFARLRTQGARHLFTVKVPQLNELACVEHETFVADREQMHRSILLMGFVPTMRIVKQRRTGVWDDAVVCVDEVAGLGTFLELERLVRGDQSGEEVQEDLDVRARSLGVDMRRTSETYDSLLRSSVLRTAHPR